MRRASRVPPSLRAPACAVLCAVAAALAPRGAAAQRGDWSSGYDDYTAPRDAAVDARGARRLSVQARAGFLRVRGVDGLTEVRVRGTARASRRAALDGIRLVARREGDVVVVRADVPDGWGDDGVRALDLTLEVPRGIAADVVDGSGELEIRGVGTLDLKDGSGEIRLEDVGPTRIEDGSGEIDVRDVRGDLRVSDGSGGIEVRGVRGSVIVERDGSGGIDVHDVAGDLTVERGRARGIDYAGVRGRVTLPSDGRARRTVWY